MNLGKLNDWLGVLTNIGIVVGLVYVALEYEQNSNLIEFEAQANFDSQVNNVIDVVIQDGELVEIMGKERSSLTVVESDRLRLLGIRMFLALESSYRNTTVGLGGNLERTQSIQRAIFHRPRLNYGLPLAWPTYKERGLTEFVGWFERNVVANPTNE